MGIIKNTQPITEQRNITGNHIVWKIQGNILTHDSGIIETIMPLSEDNKKSLINLLKTWNDTGLLVTGITNKGISIYNDEVPGLFTLNINQYSLSLMGDELEELKNIIL